ncbi:hypothetical protein BDV38DRAFT_289328 [Aspergillus pseudotamarii]|uniref:AMP-dependent synthetase/ligase domain-containing protein n=1 Tax=Aspergillus pseudotamarii TaxID=132259 RepID=A0A5N6SAS6_ASPPS|nr:uncharacterized protein BDV38DRAFT_289328 [Aspergillus pseudotamarii]KAE8130780.1 hypothetical protein BDV38DRAFT_289328 [Aspergillus pseudotamarii]
MDKQVEVSHSLVPNMLTFALKANLDDELQHVPLKVPRLDEFCDGYNISLTRVMHVIWSIVLGSYTSSDIVSFRRVLRRTTGHGQPWEELVCQERLTRNIPIIDVLRQEKTYDRNHNGIPDTKESDTLLFLNSDSRCELQTLEGHDTTNIKIILTVENKHNELNARLSYWKTKLSDLEAQGMAATVSKTATDIVNQPFTSIGDLVLCSDHDLSILRKWNERLPIWHDECVHHAISQRVRENPGMPAVNAWDGNFTYSELERLSSNLAAHLTSIGVTPERFVALYFEKSKWFIVAILGVIKAGGAYVLLDPSYPRSRMQVICDELRATTVLASVGLAPTAENLAKNIVAVGEDAECLGEEQDVSNLISACPDNPLYVVFTSDSTGKPKGIIMEHGAFCSWARTTGQSLCLDSRSRVLQFSSHAFLVVHRDVLLTLMFGACICVPSEADRVNNIERFMTEYRINWANLTPSVAALLSPEKVPNLQTLVFTGEPMSRASLGMWANKVNVIYGCGQSECVSISLMRKNPGVDSDLKNVGRGVGSAIWLVDPQDHDKLVPIGAIGELVIEGTAIARGYVNNTEKTQESFLRDAAWLQRVRPEYRGRRLYKTGDLAQFTDDGTVRFLGRKDNTVKVHGQRLEVEEVERHVSRSLLEMPDAEVHDVVVDLVSLPNTKGAKLTVFLGLSPTTQAIGNEALLGSLERAPDYLRMIESCLADAVPRYMISTAVVPILHIP